MPGPRLQTLTVTPRIPPFFRINAVFRCRTVSACSIPECVQRPPVSSAYYVRKSIQPIAGHLSGSRRDGTGGKPRFSLRFVRLSPQCHSTLLGYSMIVRTPADASELGSQLSDFEQPADHRSRPVKFGIHVTTQCNQACISPWEMSGAVLQTQHPVAFSQ